MTPPMSMIEKCATVTDVLAAIDREAVAKIVDAEAMKPLSEYVEEWRTWVAKTDFGDGPRPVNREKLAHDCALNEYADLATRRTRALAKADTIRAMISSALNGEGGV